MLSRCNLKAIVFNDLYCAMAVCRHAEQSPNIDLRSSCEEWSRLCYSKYKREENLILCVGACMLVPLYCIYCILFLERAAPGMHFNSDIACCISAIRVNSLDDWHLAQVFESAHFAPLATGPWNGALNANVKHSAYHVLDQSPIKHVL